MYYDKPAGVNMKRLRELGITDADLVYHYVWITEFAYKYIGENSDDMASCKWKRVKRACIAYMESTVDWHFYDISIPPPFFQTCCIVIGTYLLYI